MMVGMLWLTNSKDMLSIQIQKACDYYTNKYGNVPNLILAHPSMLDGKEMTIGELTIRSDSYILPGHLWIGIEVEEPAFPGRKQ